MQELKKRPLSSSSSPAQMWENRFLLSPKTSPQIKSYHNQDKREISRSRLEEEVASFYIGYWASALYPIYRSNRVSNRVSKPWCVHFQALRLPTLSLLHHCRFSSSSHLPCCMYVEGGFEDRFSTCLLSQSITELPIAVRDTVSKWSAILLLLSLSIVQ